jgi:hypothetical protein
MNSASNAPTPGTRLSQRIRYDERMRANLGVAVAVVLATVGVSSPLVAQDAAPQLTPPPPRAEAGRLQQPVPTPLDMVNTTPTQPGASPLPISEPPSPSPKPQRASPYKQALVLDGWIGGASARVVDGSSVGLVVLGIDALYYYRYFEIGAGAAVQLEPLGEVGAIFSGLAGVKLDPAPWMRLDLLIEAGLYNISFAGGLFQTVESGGNAALPYVGGRLGTSLPIGQSGRFILGLWVSVGDAIGPAVVNTVLQDCLFGCTTVHQTNTVGGGTISIGLRIGGDIVGRQ